MVCLSLRCGRTEPRRSEWMSEWKISFMSSRLRTHGRVNDRFVDFQDSRLNERHATHPPFVRPSVRRDQFSLESASVPDDAFDERELVAASSMTVLLLVLLLWMKRWHRRSTQQPGARRCSEALLTTTSSDLLRAIHSTCTEPAAWSLLLAAESLRCDITTTPSRSACAL